MVRAARQFLYHARFEPGMPAAEDETCRLQVREIVSRSPAQAQPGDGESRYPGIRLPPLIQPRHKRRC